MSESIIYEQDHRVVTITLNRPDTRNALSGDLIDGLINALEKANRDKNVGCVILTGAGKSFSSGGNLQEIKNMTTKDNMSQSQLEDWYRFGIQKIPLTMNAIDVPIVAAVNGHAIGAGNDLCTMCDIRIAGEDAKFSESFLRIGIIPGDGGSWFLPKIIGLSRAAEMILTCDVLDAEKALNWGLVSQIVKNEELIIQAKKIANKIASQPPEATRRAKRLLRMSQNVSLDNALEMAASQQSILQMMDDHREALDALIEKRKPKYTNS
ncbi:enoyl-CoA hydratase-related protein [Alphaproteobacteria bacterium]|jgi:enoyl-CoA hydratase/carnithine racemase|nr:enoyl-CoA hydratase-related protein [Alphaproteobacteria bacterium]|tara:strand:+ start:422 stop:1219 length:798 start_codon:yes stop_codon:yes gene_type:complete